jgi:exonuclease III
MLTLVSWNCSWERGGFSNEKFIYITKKYNPHILIIQECKYNECIQADLIFQYSTWYGDGKDSRLGIGIFSKEQNIKLADEFKYDKEFRYVIPYSLKLSGVEVTLFAVWTKNYIDKKFHNLSYTQNIPKAIEYYKDLLKKNSILIGDFNSADKPDIERKEHKDLIDKFLIYNIHNRISKDLETKPTFYMNFDEKNPFTNDYCFASENVKITNVEIGEYKSEYSDHCPLIVSLDY